MSGTGLFRDVSNNIEGTPGPLFSTWISRRRKGRRQKREKDNGMERHQPKQNLPTDSFKENIDHPDVVVSSTHYGSITREMFVLFLARHFIRSLPKELGPIILLLDGHGSRWSVPALQLLMANTIYRFFVIASHTSIWVQPTKQRRCRQTIPLGHGTSHQAKSSSRRHCQHGILRDSFLKQKEVTFVNYNSTTQRTRTNVPE
jgi:hypothetical protein